MTAEALEARMEKLEEHLQQVEVEIHTNKNVAVPQKRRWCAFSGVDADNSDFADAVRQLLDRRPPRRRPEPPHHGSTNRHRQPRAAADRRPRLQLLQPDPHRRHDPAVDRPSNQWEE